MDGGDAGPDEVARIGDYDDEMRAYYRSRTGGRKESSWSEEMAGLLDGERRPHNAAISCRSRLRASLRAQSTHGVARRSTAAESAC